MQVTNHSRQDELTATITKLKALKYLNSVVVLWHSSEIVHDLYAIRAVGVPIYHVNFTEETTLNRSFPLSLITTEAVFMTSSDMSLSAVNIQKAFR